MIRWEISADSKLYNPQHDTTRNEKHNNGDKKNGINRLLGGLDINLKRINK